MSTITDQTAIEELLIAYGNALNASNVGRTTELYTDDGVLMPQGAPIAKGRDQLKGAYEALFKLFQLDVQYISDAIIVTGDYAFARTSSKGKTVIRSSAENLPIDNKELFVLQKDNGQWKIAQYIFNNNKVK